MRGLPSTGGWEVVNYGILRSKNSALEYIEDRGDSFGNSYWTRTVTFQYGYADSGYLLVLSPIRILPNYPATAVIFPDGLTYNPNTKVCNFKVGAKNCLAWFNWEIYEIFRGKARIIKQGG